MDEDRFWYLLWSWLGPAFPFRKYDQVWAAVITDKCALMCIFPSLHISSLVFSSTYCPQLKHNQKSAVPNRRVLLSGSCRNTQLDLYFSFLGLGSTMFINNLNFWMPVLDFIIPAGYAWGKFITLNLQDAQTHVKRHILSHTKAPCHPVSRLCLWSPTDVRVPKKTSNSGRSPERSPRPSVTSGYRVLWAQSDVFVSNNPQWILLFYPRALIQTQPTEDIWRFTNRFNYSSGSAI